MKVRGYFSAAPQLRRLGRHILSMNVLLYNIVKLKLKKKSKKKDGMRFLKNNVLLRLGNSYLIDSPEPANISYL